MKKLLLILSIILIYSCSKDEDSQPQLENPIDFLTIDYTSSLDSDNYVTLEHHIVNGDVVIDWGDGTTEELPIGNFFGVGSPIKHNYKAKGVYEVKISGEDNLIDLRVRTNLKNDHGFITKINVLGMSSLYTLVASYNRISQINLSNNTELRTLELLNNNLTNLDLSNNNKLKWTLHVSNNQLTSLNINNLTDLEMLYVRDNNLTSLDLSNNLKLDLVGLQNNPNLTCIKIANNQVINTVDKDDTQELNTSCN